MSKAADIAKASTTGSFHLLWGLVISTVISSVATIFVARLLGSDLYGLYGIVLVTPSLIGIFRDWGINSAMVRYAAQFRGEGRESEVRSIFVSGLIFEIAVGLALSVLSFGLSGYLATNMFHRPAIAPLIQLASITILATGIVNAASAAFTGVEKMEHNSIVLIVQSIFKTIIMIILVLQGLGTAGAVTGYTGAFAIAAATSVLIMYSIYRKLPKPFAQKLEIKAYIEAMLAYGTPLSLSTMISGFQAQFYSFLLPIFYVSDNIAIGNYGIASTFVVLIAFVQTPIITMLFPAFSKLDPKKDKIALKSVFQFSIKYASLLVVPVAMLVMCLAQPAVALLFGSSYKSAPLFLALLALTYVYTAFGTLTSGNFIMSQGKTTFYLYLTLISAAIGFPTGYLLIMQFGVLGLILTSLTTGIPNLVIALYWINKHYELTVDWISSARILSSSLIATALTYLLETVPSFPNIIRLILGVVFFTIIFIFAALLTRAVNKSDLSNLRGMASGLGPVGKIVNRILSVLEKIIDALKL
jgi:stage V sporulation protein B